MEQQFQLKHYGNLSIDEQNNLTAEDRNWWMQRLEKEFKDKAEKERQQVSSSPRSVPRMPSIPKR
jgi:hypothetical protein